eukprot:TRINITY_DN4322_c2_g2_i1.p1 TRINITY_DN4322_c2_g2~~TRINITY_DN4322_c2_g2_i1.p1  ORF type:complete len:111 (-),score=38.97 TRINITY_DN4322_c2_g2_i1:64-396(-)
MSDRASSGSDRKRKHRDKKDKKKRRRKKEKSRSSKSNSTALTKILYPSLSGLLRDDGADTEVVRGLKNAFDVAEAAEDGVTNQILRNIIEILHAENEEKEGEESSGTEHS